MDIMVYVLMIMLTIGIFYRKRNVKKNETLGVRHPEKIFDHGSRLEALHNRLQKVESTFLVYLFPNREFSLVDGHLRESNTIPDIDGKNEYELVYELTAYSKTYKLFHKTCGMVIVVTRDRVVQSRAASDNVIAGYIGAMEIATEQRYQKLIDQRMARGGDRE